MLAQLGTKVKASLEGNLDDQLLDDATASQFNSEISCKRDGGDDTEDEDEEDIDDEDALNLV